jgi:hypothetical protein
MHIKWFYSLDSVTTASFIELLSSRKAIADSFSREAWVKTNHKNAMPQGGECGVGQLYSWASRLVSVRSRGTEPKCCQAHLTTDWGGSGQTRSGWTAKRDNTELLWTETSRTVAKLQQKAVPTPLYVSYRCQAATEGFSWRLSPPRYCDWLLYFPARSSFIRKGMTYNTTNERCFTYLLFKSVLDQLVQSASRTNKLHGTESFLRC